MRRVFASALLALAAVVSAAACGNSQLTPTKPPQVDAETRLGPVRRPAKDEPVRILAPPPAYGNKIVMGQSARGPQL